MVESVGGGDDILLVDDWLMDGNKNDIWNSAGLNGESGNDELPGRQSFSEGEEEEELRVISREVKVQQGAFETAGNEWRTIGIGLLCVDAERIMLIEFSEAIMSGANFSGRILFQVPRQTLVLESHQSGVVYARRLDTFR